jgi:tRNA(Ile)-lysidine synthase
VSKNASAADSASPITAAETIDLFRPLENVPVLILAVSGGPDSTALMVLAARWRETRRNGPRLVAVTVDHGLRPESKHEAAAVARLAKQLGLMHRTLLWRGRKPATGIQEHARSARYRLLSEAARKAGARLVLTAHTLDDQAETILFRMARGSGVSGLAGMGFAAPMPVREGEGLWLVRPLLGVLKSRLVATLEAAGIPYADDPTNRDPRFTRPRIRELMPLLAREGLTAARLALLARRIARIESALVRVMDHAQSRLTSLPWPDKGPILIKADALVDLPHEFALRLLGQAIAFTGDEGPVALGKLEALFAEFAAGLSETDGHVRIRRTLAGAVVCLCGGQVTVERAPPRKNRLTTRSFGRPKNSKRR